MCGATYEKFVEQQMKVKLIKRRNDEKSAHDIECRMNLTHK